MLLLERLLSVQQQQSLSLLGACVGAGKRCEFHICHLAFNAKGMCNRNCKELPNPHPIAFRTEKPDRTRRYPPTLSETGLDEHTFAYPFRIHSNAYRYNLATYIDSLNPWEMLSGAYPSCIFQLRMGKASGFSPSR